MQIRVGQIPAGVNAGDIENPQGMDNMGVLSYLEKLTARYDAVIKACQKQEKRIDPAIKNKWIEFKKASL